MKNYTCVPYFIKCSLWITVFIVRVGCIIEARASNVEYTQSSIDKIPNDHIYQNLSPDLSSSSLSFKSIKRKIPFNLQISSTRIQKEDVNENINLDTCTEKKDGYYPNFSSDCTSYYFCASGYQITYICPPGKRYNGDKCIKDYDCPSIGVNICQNLPNGYYPLLNNPQKYFYCYYKAKVIELNCDHGKIFDSIWKKCICLIELEKNKNINILNNNNNNNNNCLKLKNGFYINIQSECKNYYYCIDGEKTELECKDGYLFNGDVCVQKSRFKCPILFLNETGNQNDKNSITIHTTHHTI